MRIEQTSTCDTSIYTVPFVMAGSCTPGLLTPAGITDTGLLTSAGITDSITNLGFTVGAGGEARLWSNWFLRAEYRYADFGTVRFTDIRSCASPSITIPAPGGTATFGCSPIDTADDLRVRTHTATAGIAYKFYP